MHMHGFENARATHFFLTLALWLLNCAECLAATSDTSTMLFVIPCRASAFFLIDWLRMTCGSPSIFLIM